MSSSPVRQGCVLTRAVRQPVVLRESVPEQRSVSLGPLTASIVSNPADILKLTAFVSSLAAEPGMLAPSFFLASVLSRHSKPHVVVVSEGDRIAGLLYCTERVLAGIPTAIAFGDDTLGTMLAAHPAERESVMRCAVAALLRRMRALRFRLVSDRLALLQIESAKANADLHFCRKERHAHLELPRTYDEFLANVRRPTRHNLYRYRRRSELAGNEFCPDQPFTDFCAAARHLSPKAAYAEGSNLERFLAMIEAMPSRLLTGLRRRCGEWISLAGGWCDGDRSVLCLQLNDRTRGRESISLVLRSYLIEQLINRGIRELVFWGGTSAPLNNYTSHREEVVAYVDSRSYPWRLVRLACIKLAKLAPRKFSNWLEWQAPGCQRKN